MKVKVRRVSSAAAVANAVLLSDAGQRVMQTLWPFTVSKMKTEKLQEIARMHMSGRRISQDALFVVLDELARRREESGKPFRSNEEAWAEFQAHYMPKEPGRLIDPTGTPLAPSFHGEDCLGNGEHPGIECCCDECEHYLTCFPDWKEQAEQP